MAWRDTREEPAEGPGAAERILPQFTLQVRSDREALLEGRCTLKEYEEERIAVCCKDRLITFTGTGLSIDALDPNQFCVRGELTGILFSSR